MKEFLERLFRRRVSLDDGSYLEFQHREAIRYVEPDGHQMEIEWYFSKNLSGGRILYIPDLARWDPPHAAESITAEKQSEILEKVKRYASVRGVPLEVFAIRPPSA